MVFAVAWQVPNVERAVVECTRDAPGAAAYCSATVDHLLSPRVEIAVADATAFVKNPEGREKRGYCVGISDPTTTHPMARVCLFSSEDINKVINFLREAPSADALSVQVSDNNWMFSAIWIGGFSVAGLTLFLWGSWRRRDVVWVLNRERGELKRVHTSMYSTKTETLPLSKLGRLGVVGIRQVGYDNTYALAFQGGDIPPAWERDSDRVLQEIADDVNEFLQGPSSAPTEVV